MFTVVIPTLDAEPVLTHTLAGLVSAAADGAVREVVIADGGSSDATAEIADATGCLLVDASAPGGAACREGAAFGRRGRWLLFLQAGVSLEQGWHHDALSFAEKAERAGRHHSAAVFRYAVDDIGFRPRLEETAVMLERMVSGLPRETQGLLVSRAWYDELGGHRPCGWVAGADLARRIGRRRLFVLRTRAWMPREFADASAAPRFWQRSMLALGCPPQLLQRS